MLQLASLVLFFALFFFDLRAPVLAIRYSNYEYKKYKYVPSSNPQIPTQIFIARFVFDLRAPLAIRYCVTSTKAQNLPALLVQKYKY